MHSLKVMKIIANSDPTLFEHLLKDEGLRIVGLHANDPLEHSVQSESVEAIASVINDDEICHPNQFTQRQQSFKRLAEDLGYIIALEDFHQAGADFDPDHMTLRHPHTDTETEEEAESDQAEQQAEQQPPAPEGGDQNVSVSAPPPQQPPSGGMGEPPPGAPLM